MYTRKINVAKKPRGTIVAEAYDIFSAVGGHKGTLLSYVELILKLDNLLIVIDVPSYMCVQQMKRNVLFYFNTTADTRKDNDQRATPNPEGEQTRYPPHQFNSSIQMSQATRR